MQIDQKRSDDTTFGFFSGFSGIKGMMTQEQNHHSGPPAHSYFTGSKVAPNIHHQYRVQTMMPHREDENLGNHFALCFAVEVREMCLMLNVLID